MLASPRNRATLRVDDPWSDDGFYRVRRFKTHVPALKGKRPWRRVLRHVEAQRWRRGLRATGEA